MNERQLKDRISSRYERPSEMFFSRPYFSRRSFFQLMGAGVTGSMLASPVRAGDLIQASGAPTLNTARNTIFILLAGAASHVDTFDFKETPSTPMELMQPVDVNGIAWPAGLMPKLADRLGELTIVRSAESWALQHNLAQVWAQIGRNPAAALGDIAPNTGAVVALEKEAERQTGQVFPTFLALNSNGAIGSGYMPSLYEPLKITPAAFGLPNTIHPEAGGESRFQLRYDLLSTLDGPLRQGSPFGEKMVDYAGFYESGRDMMYNASVEQAFRFTDEESARFGPSGFGNACLVASQVLAANGGTRYIMITFGGWDHHQDIYDEANLPLLAWEFDAGFSTLLDDLKSSGQLHETLVVVMGEFGRTPGPITAQAGRDHYLRQFVAFAGAGIPGGRTFGATDPLGAAAVDFGWDEGRYIKPEDVEATIYSAMGIDWTTIRYDDPFGRGFEYVFGANEGLYRPITELWA